MIEKTIIAEENRFDTVLTDGLPRLEAEIAKALEHAGAALPGDAAFRLYDTFGVPYDFIEDTAATRGVRVDREGFERAMEVAARQGARAERLRRPRKAATEFAWPTRQRSPASATSSTATRATRVTGVPVVALFDEHRQPVDALSSGRDRLRRARADAVLPRSRRPGVGLGAHRQRGDRCVRGRRGAGAHPRRAAARASRARRTRRAARPRHRHRRGGRAAARRDAPESHGDPPAARGAAPGARHPRQAGGVAGRTRPPAVRLRALPAGDA